MERRPSIIVTRIFLFLLFFTMIYSRKTEAASTKYKAYNKILSKPVIDMYGETHRVDSFALLDINQDGKKELFVSWFRSIQVYTLQGKSAKLLKEFSTGMGASFNKKDKTLVVFYHGGTGMGGYVLCKMKNRKLKKIRDIYTQGDYIGNKYVQYYFINGKRVSEKKYIKYKKKYFDTTKNRYLTWHRNTVSKRNKYLK